MKVITSKMVKGKKMFLIDDENYQDGGVIEDTSVDESKEFLKNWYLNRKEIPEFKDISENFLKQLPLVKNIEYKGYEPYSKKGNVYMLPSTNKFVKNHEYTHAIHFRASGYNYGKNIINSVTNKSDKYLSDPTEVYARLNVLRQSLNLDPLKKYNLEETKEILNNANKIGQKSSQGVLNSFENGDYSNTPSNNGNEEQIFELLKVIDNKPENLQKLLNEIALNNQKTDNFKNLAKYGKVIEDNQGQWKYPGQITKINSPNITMEGVNYPVLGISEQTGEQKLMFPENNYKFKSTKAVIEYPITAQAGTTVKINKDNVVKEYDRRSPEYKAMYDSGRLMSYDKSTDTYRATPLETFEVKTKAPQWLIDKRNIEKNFTKEKFVKKYLPKWSGSMGETADNLSENAQKDYEKKVNDKLANIILKRNPKLGKSTEDRLKWAESLTEKERDIVNRSSYANKFLPAMNAYNENQSNLTKNYSTRALLSDADKLAQSVEGTPERFRLFPNAENNIESYVNPGMFIGSMAKGLGNVPKDIKNENYGQAALSIATPLSVGAFAGIGNPSTGQFVNNLVNPLAGTGDLINNLGNKYLPNAHKLNPYAFKPNPEKFYRQIGDGADALESGVIRSADQVKYPRPHFVEGKDFDVLYSTGEGATRNNNIIAEMDMVKDGEMTAFQKNVNSSYSPYQANLAEVPLSDVKLYKQDWLKGYKPIEISKKSINTFKPQFESEINWGKWNKEIPDNPQLMKEYNTIEQTSKANGTWMKNPDGSKFQGTPEQFVQQNSENFKKAFPEGSENVFRGTGENIAELRPNRSIFTANQELASGYAPFNKKSSFLNSESTEGGLHNFYRKNSKNSLELDANNTSWTSVDLSNRRLTKDYFERNIKFQEEQLLKRKNDLSKLKQLPNGSWTDGGDYIISNDLYKNWITEQELYLRDLKERYKNIDNLISNPKELEEMKKVLGNTTTTDDIAAYVEKRNLDYVKLKNIEDPGIGDVTIVNHKPGNYLKSAVGNNGMFDMTNPNIYKTLIPGAMTLGALNQTNEKQFGGTIKVLDTKIEKNKKYYLINE
jgi:hypothetical protein